MGLSAAACRLGACGDPVCHCLCTELADRARTRIDPLTAFGGQSNYAQLGFTNILKSPYMTGMEYPEGWVQMWGEIARCHEARVFCEEYHPLPVGVKNPFRLGPKTDTDSYEFTWQWNQPQYRYPPPRMVYEDTLETYLNAYRNLWGDYGNTWTNSTLGNPV